MKKCIYIFLLINTFIFNASGQSVIKTNLFSTISNKKEITLTYKKYFSNKASYFLTISHTYKLTNNILRHTISNNTYKHTFLNDRPNLDFEVGFFNKNYWGLGVSYGNIFINKAEKYCENPQPFSDSGSVIECDAFKTYHYNSKSHVVGLQFYKGFSLLQENNFILDFLISGQLQGIWNYDPIYSLSDIAIPLRDQRNDIAFRYIYNLSYDQVSYYLIPKLELHAGFKI